MIEIFNHIYAGKRVLVTGHTGFKGTWLSIWLNALGAEVIGYALPPDTNPSIFDVTGLARHITHIEADIRDSQAIAQVVEKYQPELVFHLAAQPLVRLSYEEPRLTYETNIMGTVNLLEAVRASESVKVCMVVTSDKCYENQEWLYAYRENDSLGGHDPYSSSKAAAELVVNAYQRSYFNVQQNDRPRLALASVRAGNVIGGGDWASDRIVPDAVKALAANKPIKVRNPQAIRPWQHVLEALAGYLWLAASMWDQGARLNSPWNFGPNQGEGLTVGQLGDKIVDQWGSGHWQDVSSPSGTQVHEAQYLKLDCTKAQTLLGWSPLYRIEQALDATITWYRKFYDDPAANMLEFTLSQVEEYASRARQLDLKWAGKVGENDSQN